MKIELICDNNSDAEDDEAEQRQRLRPFRQRLRPFSIQTETMVQCGSEDQIKIRKRKVGAK